jgi:hypothetical protein
MRVPRFVLGICGAVVCAPLLLAQQKPIYGCNGAVTCNRPLGYTALTGNPSVFFGVGAHWGPGFQFLLVTPTAEAPGPETTPDIRVFHLKGVSLLPPVATPTPGPSPQPTPVPPGRG